MLIDKTKLIFIYNADAGFLNGALDSAHKILSPSTYSCDLCSLTHGAFGARKQWKKFMEDADFEAVFYHKNDVPEALRHVELPSILWGNELTILVSASDFKSINSLDELINTIKEKTS